MKRMTKVALSLTLILTLVGGIKASAEENIIKDNNLKNAINAEFKRDLEQPVTKDDLKNLKQLLAPANNIRSLEGLQYAENLETLEVAQNEISDISPLKDLKNLKVLNVINQKVNVQYDESNLKPIIDRKGNNPKLEDMDGVVDEIRKSTQLPHTYSFSTDSFSGVVNVTKEPVEKQKPFSNTTIVRRDDKPIEQVVEEEKARKEGKLEVTDNGDIKIKGGMDTKSIAIISVCIVASAIFLAVTFKKYKEKKSRD